MADDDGDGDDDEDDAVRALMLDSRRFLLSDFCFRFVARGSEEKIRRVIGRVIVRDDYFVSGIYFTRPLQAATEAVFFSFLPLSRTVRIVFSVLFATVDPRRLPRQPREYP